MKKNQHYRDNYRSKSKEKRSSVHKSYMSKPYEQKTYDISPDNNKYDRKSKYHYDNSKKDHIDPYGREANKKDHIDPYAREPKDPRRKEYNYEQSRDTYNSSKDDYYETKVKDHHKFSKNEFNDSYNKDRKVYDRSPSHEHYKDKSSKDFKSKSNKDYEGSVKETKITPKKIDLQEIRAGKDEFYNRFQKQGLLDISVKADIDDSSKPKDDVVYNPQEYHDNLHKKQFGKIDETKKDKNKNYLNKRSYESFDKKSNIKKFTMDHKSS